MKEEGKKGSEGGYRSEEFLRLGAAPDNSNPIVPIRELGTDSMTSATDDLLLFFIHPSSLLARYSRVHSSTPLLGFVSGKPGYTPPQKIRRTLMGRASGTQGLNPDRALASAILNGRLTDLAA